MSSTGEPSDAGLPRPAPTRPMTLRDRMLRAASLGGSQPGAAHPAGNANAGGHVSRPHASGAAIHVPSIGSSEGLEPESVALDTVKEHTMGAAAAVERAAALRALFRIGASGLAEFAGPSPPGSAAALSPTLGLAAHPHTHSHAHAYSPHEAGAAAQSANGMPAMMMPGLIASDALRLDASPTGLPPARPRTSPHHRSRRTLQEGVLHCAPCACFMRPACRGKPANVPRCFVAQQTRRLGMLKVSTDPAEDLVYAESTAWRMHRGAMQTRVVAIIALALSLFSVVAYLLARSVAKNNELVATISALPGVNGTFVVLPGGVKGEDPLPPALQGNAVMLPPPPPRSTCGNAWERSECFPLPFNISVYLDPAIVDAPFQVGRYAAAYYDPISVSDPFVAALSAAADRNALGAVSALAVIAACAVIALACIPTTRQSSAGSARGFRKPQAPLLLTELLTTRAVPQFMVSYKWDDVSYPGSHARLASSLAVVLPDVWLDKNQLGPGDDLAQVTFRIAANVRILVILISPAYLRSPNCCRELAAAVLHRDAALPTVILMQPQRFDSGASHASVARAAASQTGVDVKLSYAAVSAVLAPLDGFAIATSVPDLLTWLHEHALQCQDANGLVDLPQLAHTLAWWQRHGHADHTPSDARQLAVATPRMHVMRRLHGGSTLTWLQPSRVLYAIRLLCGQQARSAGCVYAGYAYLTPDCRSVLLDVRPSQEVQRMWWLALAATGMVAALVFHYRSSRWSVRSISAQLQSEFVWLANTLDVYVMLIAIFMLVGFCRFSTSAWLHTSAGIELHPHLCRLAIASFCSVQSDTGAVLAARTGSWHGSLRFIRNVLYGAAARFGSDRAVQAGTESGNAQQSAPAPASPRSSNHSPMVTAAPNPLRAITDIVISNTTSDIQRILGLRQTAGDAPLGTFRIVLVTEPLSTLGAVADDPELRGPGNECLDGGVFQPTVIQSILLALHGFCGAQGLGIEVERTTMPALLRPTSRLSHTAAARPMSLYILFLRTRDVMRQWVELRRTSPHLWPSQQLLYVLPPYDYVRRSGPPVTSLLSIMATFTGPKHGVAVDSPLPSLSHAIMTSMAARVGDVLLASGNANMARLQAAAAPPASTADSSTA